jgi:CheY-like chemotaxis protein
MRILVVDDDPAVRAYLSAVLREAGHDVPLTAGGREATRICGLEPLDALVTDLCMPDGEGLETIQTLHRQRRT